MAYYLLQYDVVDDYESRRAPYRPLHLAYARDAQERGELILAGALANPTDAALLIFKGDSPDVASAFAESDPYVLNGLIPRWRVREWTVVLDSTIGDSQL